MLARRVSFLSPMVKHIRYPFEHMRKHSITSMRAVQSNSGQSATENVDIDHNLFTSKWTVYALRVPPRHCQVLRKVLKSHLLVMPRTQVVVKSVTDDGKDLFLLSRYLAHTPDQEPDYERVNLDSSYVGRASDVAGKFVLCGPSAPESVREFVTNITDDRITTWDVKQTYADCNIEQVLRTLLPDEVQVPSSFETVGHIAHVNLRDEHMQWKYLIGRVMVDKLGPRIRTIVNKTESTGGPYRTFTMEVIGGDHDFVTTVKENGCLFELDFAKVYWNSRLEREHRRIVDSFSENDIVLDAFCGVGPFAVAAAKRGRCSKVYANDLNPTSVKYLKMNVEKNAISEGKIETSCLCAREYIRDVAGRKIPFSKVLMNFPSGAPEFLDVFRNLYSNWEGEKPKMPTIHCYCFVKGDNEFESARSRVRQALYGNEKKGLRTLPDSALRVRLVRDVAPRKVQVCVTFELPEEVGFETAYNGAVEARMKKARMEGDRNYSSMSKQS